MMINSGYPGKVAGALQIDAFQMIKAFCKPRIKVGTEWVIKGQVSNSSFSLERILYFGRLRPGVSWNDFLEFGNGNENR